VGCHRIALGPSPGSPGGCLPLCLVDRLPSSSAVPAHLTAHAQPAAPVPALRSGPADARHLPARFARDAVVRPARSDRACAPGSAAGSAPDPVADPAPGAHPDWPTAALAGRAPARRLAAAAARAPAAIRAAPAPRTAPIAHPGAHLPTAVRPAGEGRVEQLEPVVSLGCWNRTIGPRAAEAVLLCAVVPQQCSRRSRERPRRRAALPQPHVYADHTPCLGHPPTRPTLGARV
jgi:DNA polymerase-3 subunit gamma/tau